MTAMNENRKKPPLPARLVAFGAINVVGLFVAGWLGLVRYADDFWVLLLAGLVLAAFNLMLRPVMMVLSVPFIVVTLGFFVLVVNAMMLWLTSEFVPDFDLIGFWRTILAVIMLWLANLSLGGLLKDYTGKR